ncbi:hypothetical protein GCM10010909_15900 [Acidocella aquatica]|uniref:Uncharacterized protein n=1 Tax=Acidocella aquatica TaxID=1922313 RepID=A0ABQ6A346_9PROT|nr:hypothetical protein [Acidocella aquatica]GLR66910.1 hypothetical protein GCM10010909_15900 [Acidocella aquatica]
MLPRAIAAALQLPKLDAADFTDTKFDTAEVKAKFGNNLLRFIAEDFPKTLWTKAFYRRLSMIFSNIAHYNEHGFWETWFETTADQIEFLLNIAQYPCWGDPAFTYSDVETIIGKRVKTCGVIAWKQKLLVEERKKKDLAQLARLKEIYEPETVAPLSLLQVAASSDMTQTDLFS